MSEDIGRKLAATASGEIYIEIKNWLKKFDFSGTKIEAYREGIKENLGQIRVMGMAGGRDLDDVYISLRFVKDYRKNKTKIFQDIGEKEEKIVKKIKKRGFDDSHDDLHGEIDDLEYTTYDIDATMQELGYTEYKEWLKSYEDGLTEIENIFKGNRYKEFSEEYVQESRHGLDAVKILNEHKKVVILGQPGSGKTTFLKYVALSYCGFVPMPGRREYRLPIFVPLREVSKIETREATAESFLKIVLECVSNISMIQFSEDWIKDKLKKGQCAVLIDGLDEIKTSYISYIVRSITNFSTAYSKNKIAITCRTASFHHDMKGFQICEVEDFNQNDIKKFAKKWFSLDTETYSKFISEITVNKSALDLCKNPMLVSMVCIQFQYHRDLPQSRAELYDSCINTLMYRWDTFRSIDREVCISSLSHDQKKNIIAKIARMTFDTNAYIFHSDRLRKLLQKEVEFFENPKIDVDGLIHDYEANHGLIIERLPNYYCFSHLSFQEYLCSLSYTAMKEENDVLKKALDNPRYIEVLCLSLEKSFDPVRPVVEMITYIKGFLMNEEFYSSYHLQLVERVSNLRIPLPKKVRYMLGELKVDLHVSETKT